MRTLTILLFFLVLALQASAQPYTWKNVPIGGGGFVTGIITHPTEKGLMYARTDIGGAYRWDASAKRWIPITDWIGADDWSDMGIESIAVDPADANRVYMAVGTYVTNWSPTNGAILRSEDRGKTWKRTELPFKNGGNEPGRSLGERLAVDPGDSKVILFGTRTSGLWKSEDRGETWKHVAGFPAIATSGSASSSGKWSRPLGIAFLQFDAKAHAIYAGVATRDKSMYRSNDGGETWSEISNQPKGLRPNHCALASDGTLYISYGDDPGPNTMTDGAVWKLDTSTGRWTNITPEQPSEKLKFGYGSVAVDAQHPQTILAGTFNHWTGGDDIFRSTDGGKTWKSLKANCTRDISAGPWLADDVKSHPFGHWIGDVEIDPHNSDHVIYTTGWGVWSSEDCTKADENQTTHWAFSSQGIEECVANNVISPPSGAQELDVVWDIDGFRHENVDVSPSEGYFKPSFGRNTDIDFAEKNPDIVVRVGDNKHGACSTDNGRTWKMFESATGNGGGDIAVSADGETIVWTPENSSPQVSHDRGASWKLCAGIAAKVRVVSDRENKDDFFAFDSTEGKLLASTDGGEAFSPKASNLPHAEGFLRAAPGLAGDLWLASGGGLYHSSDGGTSFAKIDGVDGATHIGFGKAAPRKEFSAIYIVGNVKNVYGFYRSDDAGTSWLRINDDTHQFGQINAISGDPRIFGRVYLASASRGIIYGESAGAGGEK